MLKKHPLFSVWPQKNQNWTCKSIGLNAAKSGYLFTAPHEKKPETVLHRPKLPLVAIFAKKNNFRPICCKNGQFKLQLIGFHLEMALFRTEKAIVSPAGLSIFTGGGEGSKPRGSMSGSG